MALGFFVPTAVAPPLAELAESLLREFAASAVDAAANAVDATGDDGDGKEAGEGGPIRS